MKTLHVTLTGGGTGGHVVPALAVARCFGRAPSEHGVQCSWIGTGSPERELVTAAGIPFYAVTSGKLRRYFSLRNVIDPFKLLWGTWQSWRLLGRLRPDVVFSKGGFVAVPVCWAARLRRIPVITHESDATPGLATRLIARVAHTVLLGSPTGRTWTTARTVVVGNPIRDALLHGDAARGRAGFGVRTDRPLLLVLGGSTGAQAINELVAAAVPALLRTMDILHQTGAGKATPLALPGYVQREYLDEGEMADALAAADLVVSRSGASSVNELAAAGKATVFIPLPLSSSRGDQIANVAPLVAAGAAVVLDQERTDAALLTSTVAGLVADPARRSALGVSISRFGHRDAAERIAEEVLHVAERRA